MDRFCGRRAVNLGVMTTVSTAQPDSRWQTVLDRDPSSDFVYAVSSTGVYCRPSCPSRRPKRENVSFFSLPELAEAAGYRACKRCQPQETHSPALADVREVCRFLEANAPEPLTLKDLAAQVDLSVSHLQRKFKAAVGVSPQVYLDALRVGRLKELLRAGDDISGAAFEAGLGGSLYRKAGNQLGMTPKRYKERGADLTVRYAVTDSPLGKLLVAATDKGVCAVSLGNSEAALTVALRQEFSGADLTEDGGGLKPWTDAILEHLSGQRPHLDLPTDVRTTAFQAQVWQALREIPYGETRSYQEVAEAIGKPKAVRAVASACAKNPVALLNPCHRVVRKSGELSGYRWGTERKQKLLELEAAQQATQQAAE